MRRRSPSTLLTICILLPLRPNNSSLIHVVASFSPSLPSSARTSCCCVKRHQRIFPSKIRTNHSITCNHLLQPKIKMDSDDENEGNTNSKISSIIEQVDPLEIRLDATLLAIYVLCRFLFYDVTTGVKQTPGWELHDVIMLLQTFSSAIVLAGLWTLVGVFGTGLFQYDTLDVDNELRKRLIANVIISAPLWVVIEIVCGWPTAGVFWLESTGGIAGLESIFLGNQEWQLLFTLMGAGFLGVGFMMVLGRYLRQHIA